MTRRLFASGALSGAAFSTMQAQTSAKPRALYELQYYRIRNTMDNQRKRLSDFLANSMAPAVQRAGGGPVGLFSNTVADRGPFLLAVVSFPSMAAMTKAGELAAKDSKWIKEMESFYSGPGLPYERMDTQLIEAFAGMPTLEVPETTPQRPARIFELRTYESNTPLTLEKKVEMFEKGEIEIFRKTGLLPVFFGRTIIGPNMPNLTYLLAFDNLAAREKNWGAFVSHPDWLKLRATPGWSDGEIVSNISNVLLSPIAGSQIR